MGMLTIFQRGDERDYRDYKKALKTAKMSSEKLSKAVDVLCEITEDMEDQFADEEPMAERRGRTSMRGDSRYREDGMDDIDAVYARRYGRRR